MRSRRGTWKTTAVEKGIPVDFGPVQILVVGFADDGFDGDVLPELRRLSDHDVIRLLDLQFMTKDEAGNLTRTELAALTPEESARLGTLVAR